jgi:lipoprotein signal peptidase
MVYIILVTAFIAMETLIKNYMEANMKFGERKEILKGKIVINKCHNEGAFLNFLDKKKEIVKTVSFVMLGLLLLLFTVMLPKKGNKLFKLGLSLVLGGAVSNVSDRCLRGYVVDYFSFQSKKFQKLNQVVFNLADIAIFLGSFFIFLSSAFSGIFKSGSDKSAK